MRECRRLLGRAAAAAALVLTTSITAHAQSGPLTGVLKMEEPKTFGVHFGPLTLSPDLSLPAIGYESNVFDDDANPQEDWTFSMNPDLRFHSRTGLLRAVAMVSTELTYFQKYASERSVGRSALGRAELTLSRFQPWVAGALVNSRNRANREVSLRARRQETEVSTGINFTMTPLLGFFVMGSRVDTAYDDNQLFKDVSLGRALNFRTESASAGTTLQVTPFTRLVAGWAVERDTFERVDSRNARAQEAALSVEFSPEAAIRGSARVGYRDFRPDDSTVPAFRGLTTSGTIGFQVLGMTTVETTVLRQVQYSFEEQLGYYVETGVDVTYTQRIAGPYDFQLEGSRRQLDYTRVMAGLRPVVNSYQGGLGYNFRDNSRVGLNYEYSQRVDEERPDRRFNRRRVFASFTYELR